MTKRMEQTQNAKMVQLALFREYGFQPCLKDIKILNTRDFDEFPGHAETMKIKNLRIKQLIKVANLMNRYPALSEAQQEVYQYATNIVYLIF